MTTLRNMKLKVVSIGNSRGVRIPKPLLEQAGIGTEVEVEAEGNTLVLRSTKPNARSGWAKAFQAMAERGDDQLLDSKNTGSFFDQDDWEWK